MSDNERLIEIQRAVAAELGEGWSIHQEKLTYGDWWAIDGPNGMMIAVSAGTERATAFGFYPHRPGQGVCLPWNTKQPEVGCNVMRPAADIARDIVRRLLPKYRELYAQACQIAAQHDDFQAQKNAATERVARAFEPLHGRLSNRGDDGVVFFDRGQAQVSPEMVDLHCSVTIEQAEAIAVAIFENRREA